MLANAAVPLVGVADAFVVGVSGDVAALAGVALGNAVFSLIYWGFYALRMGATGLTAQAEGAGDAAEVDRVLLRGLALAAVIGAFAGAITLAPGVLDAVFRLTDGTPAVEAEAAAYVGARAGGAIGALGLFVITGWWIGQGRTRETMIITVTHSALNAGLDVGFVLGLGWGAFGVGLGTALADGLGCAVALIMVWRQVRRRGGWAPDAWDRAAIFAWDRLKRLFGVSRDLIIRSYCLVLAFAWFANAGARAGTEALAGNHVLLQFITVCAFVLDSFAFTLEAETGRAVGAGDRARLRRGLRITSELALLTGVGFALATWVFAPPLLSLLVADETARAAALEHRGFAAAAMVVGVLAWQMDGVFIGATRAPAMRNAALVAVAVYIALDWRLTPALGNTGAWGALLVYYFARGLTLAVGYPRLERSLSPA